jgi:amidase
MPLIRDTARAFMPYPDVPVPHAAAGPLAGLRFGVKDLFDVAGYPTSGGQPFLLAMSGIKTHTAPTVQKLLDAGAQFAGKTITDELAYSMTGNNAHFGAPVNGAAPMRISGGSSSGSAAAVSNRLVDFALGTDTGGSVRAPASHCGLIGLRPTQGRVSLERCLDLSPSFDTCGWFARDMPTFARVATVLLGPDSHPLPERVRLLIPTDLWAQAVPEAAATLAQARTRVEAALGPATPVQAVNVVLGSLDEMFWAHRYAQGFEAWATDGPLIQKYQPPLGASVATRFEWCRQITDQQVADARSYRQRFRTHLAALLGTDGVLLLPTMPDIAPLRTETEEALEDYRNRATRLLCLAGLSGCPQLTLPLAGREGAPLGVSLLGPAGSDWGLLEAVKGDNLLDFGL